MRFPSKMAKKFKLILKMQAACKIGGVNRSETEHQKVKR
jgi:hypothetical protein